MRNIYFEPVPLDLLAGVVTEAGLLDCGSVGAALEARRRQYAAAFQLQA